MKLTCKYLEACRGCSLGTIEFDKQKNIKKKSFFDQLQSGLSSYDSASFDYIFPVFDHYRTRSDFVYSEGRLGWYGQNKTFLPVDECALHVNKLTTLAQRIAKIPWPIKKGSMRFRIGPDGQCGVWMDLANLDIKTILESSELLTPLFEEGFFVEMGQKGKRVIKTDTGFKLSDPVPAPWFQTRFKDQTVSLNALISSFTQTNPDLNVKMIGLIQSFLKDKSFSEIVEFGSGVGNFTLFLSEMTKQLSVIENDLRNLIPLRVNLKAYPSSAKVEIFENVNGFLKQSTPSAAASSLYFVNPARSGVGALFDQEMGADHVVYVSCYMDSFVSDVVKLEKQGFKLQNAILFDQFPHSTHFEVLSYFKR